MTATIRFVKAFWNRSIQRQLMLGIALVHAILMTIFVIDLVSRQRTFLDGQNVKQTESLAKSLAANSVSWVLSDDVIGLEEVINSQKSYPNIEFAMILSSRGKVLAHTDNSKVGLYVQDPVSLSLLNGEPNVNYLLNDDNLIDIGVPIYSGPKHIGWSRVAISKNALQNNLRKILRDGIGYTILAIIVGSLFAIAMSRGITKGIRDLLKVTSLVEKGVTDVQVKTDRTDEIGHLGQSFNNMIEKIRQAMSALEQSSQLAMEEKEKAETYLNTAMIAFLALDLDGNVILANPHCQTILKYQDKELPGKNWIETCIPDQDRQDISQKYTKGISTGNILILPTESKVLTKNNDIIIMEWQNTFLHDPAGNITGILSSGIDVTEKKKTEYELSKYRYQLEDLVNQRTSELEKTRNQLEQENKNLKKAEEQIKASLKEKEILLQEIHHRVKNNMAVISGLLSLQANSTEDERLKDALTVSQNRVQSMSAIHEVLYQSDNLSSIDMNTYLSKLAGAIAQNYRINTKVNIKVESEDILIGTKQASTLGLIVNELITNSFKYAFPEGKEGEIKIKLQKREGEIELEYADKGIGMPDDLNWHEAKSMGLKLVKMLSENQLGGSIDMESKNGTKFIIKFNIEA